MVGSWPAPALQHPPIGIGTTTVDSASFFKRTHLQLGHRTCTRLAEQAGLQSRVDVRLVCALAGTVRDLLLTFLPLARVNVGPMVYQRRNARRVNYGFSFCNPERHVQERTVCGIGRGARRVRVIGAGPTEHATVRRGNHLHKGPSRGREAVSMVSTGEAAVGEGAVCRCGRAGY